MRLTRDTQVLENASMRLTVTPDTEVINHDKRQVTQDHMACVKTGDLLWVGSTVEVNWILL